MKMIKGNTPQERQNYVLKLVEEFDKYAPRHYSPERVELKKEIDQAQQQGKLPPGPNLALITR